MIKKTVEDRYQKLTPIEHILKRPGMYIGDITTSLKKMFVVENITNLKDLKLKENIINYNPGFCKIFDEILTNSSDSSIRTNQVKYIKIDVDVDHITIENDGPGIPVQIHKEHKIYVPEMIFGHLHSGSNFSDDEEKTWGGTNGLGAKLTNIYSKKFIVETSDGKKKYKQEFTNNLSKIGKPKIVTSSKNYTKITFYPDFEKFGLESITEEMQQILLKRVIDVSVYCPKVKVYYNGILIPMKSFKDYMKMYTETEKTEMFYEKINDYWEIGVTASMDDTFKQISMVNGISTYLGGTHVNYITNLIVNGIKETLEKKHKKITIKPNDIKNRLFVFVNSKIVNPTFDTQTKENLTNRLTQQHVNGVELSDKLIKNLCASNIVEDILNYIQIKEQAELKKLNKGKVSRVKIKKLDDANMAGTSQSEKTSLCLTEGDCLQEDTEITIIREGEKINIKIKDVKLGDAVITHNNNIGLINNISKKIEKCVKIKLKNEEMLVCSDNHKWYVYDKTDNKFKFLQTKYINKNNHKLIINKNTFFDDFIKILDIEKIENDKYDFLLFLSVGDIYSSKNHKFSVFDNIDFKFKMVECQHLDKNKHFIVSYEKL